MNSTLQTILALAAVALAVAYLTWSAWKKKRAADKPGCGSDCGCAGKIGSDSRGAGPSH